MPFSHILGPNYGSPADRERPSAQQQHTPQPLGLGAQRGSSKKKGKPVQPKFRLAHFSDRELRYIAKKFPGAATLDKENGLMKIDLDNAFKDHRFVDGLKKKADYNRAMGPIHDAPRAPRVKAMAAHGMGPDNTMALVTDHTANTFNYLMGAGPKGDINPHTKHMQFLNLGTVFDSGTRDAFLGGILSKSLWGALAGASVGVGQGLFGDSEAEKAERARQEAIKIGSNELPRNVAINPGQPGAVTENNNTAGETLAPPVEDNYLKKIGGG